MLYHWLLFFTQVLKTLTSRIHSSFTSHLYYKIICLHRMCAKAWLDWQVLVSSFEYGSLCFFFFKHVCISGATWMPGVYSPEEGVWYFGTEVSDSWAAMWILSIEPRSTKNNLATGHPALSWKFSFLSCIDKSRCSHVFS